MYFPSPLPTTRLSISTSALPVGPSPAPKASLYKTPGRPSKGKFKDSLGGVQEEEGEEVLDIARGPCDPSGGRALWAALGREEVSVWAIRPKVVLAKLRRTPLSLRTHGSNASVHFHGSSHLIVTTSSGHHLLYSIVPATASNSSRRPTNEVYVLPGGDKAAEAWPKGPGEGQDLEGIVLRGEGERGMGIGDGVGCVCVTPSDLLVAVQDPPMLRIIPFPSPAQQPEASTSASRLPTFGKPAPPPPPTTLRRGSGWESLPNGMSGEGGSEAVVLDEWDWLVGRDRKDVTITSLTPLAPPPAPPSPYPSSAMPTPGLSPPPFPRTSSYTSLRTHGPSSLSEQPRRHPTSFIMTTSDGRAYLVRWTPPPQERDAAAAAAQSSASLLSPVDEQTPFGDGPVPSAAAAEGRGSRWTWSGVCFHPPVDTDRDDESAVEDLREKELDKGKGASCAAVNEPMGLVAVGCEDGTIAVYNLAAPPGSAPPPSPCPPTSSAASSRRQVGANSATPPPDHLVVPQLSHVSALKESLRSTASALATGRVTTPDGYALACGWHLGWSLWSVYGRLGSWSVAGSLGADAGGAGHGVEGERSDAFEDHFMEGVRKCFWVDGGSELVVLCPPPVHPKKKPHDEQLFVIPFAKSAVTAAHTPDNTKSAFLQMDDRVLVYRGADQPDMSVINPESDVWQHIKIPSTYIASQYPIRYAVISSDARLIAVAGPRGLTHYNALSGRWKLFDSERDELVIRVTGGMAWWSNMLIVGCEEGGQYQLRVFSRDKPLTLADSLEIVPLDSEPLVLSVFDSSLLVYTADNTFHHFLIRHVRGSTPRLRVCGSIGFEGVVADPRKVRGLSWLVPKSQQRFGDPADDLNVATIIFLISGRLVLLRPRRAAHEEVKYDLQILADRVEFYWTHLSGIGTLENSLWAWDGRRIRVWLDALTIEKVRVDARRDAYETVRESVAIPLDFYPLAVLMDKGIIVGVDQETSLRRTLDFAIFRIITTTHLFLHHILRFHLDRAQQREAVLLASHYSHLVYFAHALEILLHDVLEDEADSEGAMASTTSVLPRVIDFLDHFDECLQVVVNCARKTEVTRWEFLFSVVGKPRDLFEKCVASGFLKVAASYLLVLHNLEPLEQSSKDTVKLLKSAMEAGEWTLCRELLRFLYSLDRTGLILRTALSESAALPAGFFSQSANAASVTGATAEFRRALTLTSPPSIAATLEPHKSDGGVFPPTGRLGGLGLGDVGAATAAAGHERLV
ncbi:RIC1 family protein [Rhodotorula paludigena]|uniref:RIC1 family protein n=1 Tax=Rhodotorula paludigena TaxID=86838 RepID=UPI00316C17C1